MKNTNFSSYIRRDDDFSSTQIIGEWFGNEDDSPNAIILELDTTCNEYTIRSHYRNAINTSGCIDRKSAVAEFKKLVADKS
tara:strand:+ start:126 stop:368 length:243 start_codon:yes stop_codon:yes gene_type:complete